MNMTNAETVAATSRDLEARPEQAHGGHPFGALAALAILTLGGCGTTNDRVASAALDQTVLGTLQSFAVLGGSTVTNTGSTVVQGNLGVDPGLSITGFPPGHVTDGAIHAGDAVTLLAQADLTAAYVTLASDMPTMDLTGQDLGGLTLKPGVYHFSSSAQLTGTLTLDALGDPSAIFVFQIGSTLTTATNSRVVVLNGAGDCNVFWQVGSSATLGTTTSFKGNILALTSITLDTGATVSGRILARNGAVTMDTNAVSMLECSGLTHVAVCGDGILEAPETCDDGNLISGDGCDALCVLERPTAVCGNGVLEAGEACDDGNLADLDGCSAQCQLEHASCCGNGVVEPGETCDDGNQSDGDGCSAQCQLEHVSCCGNGVVEPGETCDDGNQSDGDGCSAQCQLEHVSCCGNGVVELGETCDDGNQSDGDGCSSACQLE
jgi:cysteine-rich repeat protein